MNISGYHLTEQIYESNNSYVYRGHREVDDVPVILKILNDEFPSPERVARFRREYEITRNLELPGVIVAYNLQKHRHTFMIVLDDFGAQSLDRLLKTGPIPPLDFLPLTIQITDILGQVHQQHIMHKDINPSNIVFNPATEQVKLIDFGISTALSRENPTFRNPNVLEGTLAYLSPEQTGRMNRVIDYRTDYYSLGVTFYELLTGELPFPTADPLELVHCHIAKHPTPPSNLNPDIPPALSEIILKLMAKNAEERYQSAAGLKADLEKCLKQIQKPGFSKKPGFLFKLAQHDISDRFQIPQKLYGREREIETLLATFEEDGFESRGAEGQGSRGDEETNLQSKTCTEQSRSIQNPKSKILLVSGPAGIGKSALVQEIYKPLTRRRCYFISGKFDQLQRNIPYFALLQAFRSLVHHLLTESEAQINAWREKLLVALGPNGQVIIAVIPEVELIIGSQPPVPDLAPTEAQNRFNLTFQNFINLFTQAEHPLVIFLDDLQWADGASLKLIELLLTAPSSEEEQYLFLLGAYRDNEVNEAHPLMLTLAEIEKAAIEVNCISLSPLALSHITRLVADTLHCSPQQAAPLAELTLVKTNGNPFFVNEFLKSLHAENLLKFVPSPSISDDGIADLETPSEIVNPKSKIQNPKWHWSLEEIQVRQITDNVVELMADRAKKLSSETQAVLKLAACIGNWFDLETLAMVAEKSAPETAADLAASLVEGLILPLGDAYKYLGGKGQGLEVRNQELESLTPNSQSLTPDFQPLTPDSQFLPPITYKFAHDRVQQAVYSLIPEAERQAAHWQVGQRLLHNTPQTEREERIFDIVNQLNQGRTLIEEQIERNEVALQLAELNLLAGQKAKASAAYQPAFNYLQVGLELLTPPQSLVREANAIQESPSSPFVRGELEGGQDAWLHHYPLTLTLYTETAEAAYLSGDFDQMEKLVEVVLERAKTVLDKVKVYEVKIQADMAQSKLQEAIQTALPVLKSLGVKLPHKPNNLHILLALLRTKLSLVGKQIEDLIDLPEMTDPYNLAIMRILSTVSYAAYLTLPDLLPLITFKQVNLSVKHGNASESTYAYATYGMILSSFLGEIDSGYRFGELALRLLEKLDAKEFKTRTSVVVYALIRPWKEHVEKTIKPLQEVYQSGLETGDSEFIAMAAYVHTYHAYFTGRELRSLEQEMAKYSEAIKQLKQETALHYNDLARQTTLNLLGQAEDQLFLRGQSYDEDKMLPLHVEANDRTAIFDLYFHKLMLCYLFHAYPKAVENGAMAEKYLDAVMGFIDVPLFHFYDSLAQLALFSSVPKAKPKRFLKKVAANQKKMKKWAKHAPMNYLHKFYLVEAERARVLGNEAAAREYYDQAIDLARQNEYLNEEALANEVAARFYLSRGQAHLAAHYLREAHYAYQRWGATAKVQDLEIRYPELLAQVAADAPPTSPPSTSTSSDERPASSLDLISIIKASQTISGEIILDKLLVKLMKIVIENAGAQKGYLLLEKKGQWLVEAEAEVEAEVTVLQSVPVSPPLPLTLWEGEQTSPSLGGIEGGLLPTTLINYVAHTHKNVILDDATNEGQFSHDPYITTQQPKSILCLPLLNQARISGILYLENNLTTGAFTPERLEVLKILSTQAAISLANARFYADLKQETIERKQAEESLQSSTAKIQAIVDTAVDGIITIDERGIIESFNLAAEQIFGYQAGEALGQNVTLLMPSPYHEEHDDYLKRYLVTGEKRIISLGREVIGQRKDGTTFPLELAVSEIHLDDQHLFTGIVRDITSRKQIEAEVKQRNLELTSLNAIMSVASSLFELPQVLVTLREMLAAQLNIPGGAIFIYDETTAKFNLMESWGLPETVQAQLSMPSKTPFYRRRVLWTQETIFMAGSQSLSPQWRSYLSIPLLAQDQIKGVIDLFRPSADSNVFNAAQLAFFETLGQQVGLVIHNVRLYTHLEQSEHKYRTLFEDSKDTIFITTPAGKISDINQAGLDLFGYTRPEAMKLKAIDIYVNPADRAKYQQLLAQHGEVKNFEVMLQRKDGTRIDCLVTATSYQADDGSGLIYQGIIHDITALRQAQTELVRQERLATVGQMAAAVAHDLRNPLTGLRMGVEHFLYDLPPDDPRQGTATRLRSDMGRIERTVTDILDVARPDRLMLVPTSLASLLQAELDYWQPRLAEKEINCQAQLALDLPPILADHTQLTRALSNLIGNSLDSLPVGGTLRLNLQLADNQQVIILADDGPGIPPENLAKIFDPFFTTKTHGTGLGLAIVKRVIDDHQGTIDLWSEVGVGVKFTIKLPG